MRLLNWMVAGLTLVSPVLTSAQVIKREDLVGTWVADQVRYTSKEREAYNKTFGMLLEVPVRATFYADGLFRFVDANPPGYVPKTTAGITATAGTHGAGRWRLTGDTLWWGTDARYGNGMIYSRGELPEGPVTDTLQWKEFPANDSLFWTASSKERGDGYWHLTAYKLSRKGDQLVMTRIADRSNNDWDPPGGTYAKKTKPLTDPSIGNPLLGTKSGP